MKNYAYRKSVSEAQERSARLRNIARENAAKRSNDGFVGETGYVDYPAKRENKSVTYRVYTEEKDNLDSLAHRYFDGFTRLYGVGSYKGTLESTVVLEIIGTPADLQNIVNLAGDIRGVNAQESVLITWSEVSRLDVTASLVNACQSVIG
jgi:hypothetical protein